MSTSVSDSGGGVSPSYVSSVSGRPIHPPERFEATREKSPHRVEGGKKGAASRGLVVHESEDEQPKLDQEEIPTTDRYGSDLLGPDFHPGKNPTRQEVSRRVARERGHEAFVEMGKKGGSTQAGIHAGQINKLDADDYRTYLDHPEVGVPEKNPNRVVGGKKAAATRGNEVHGEPNVGPNAGGNTRGTPREQDQKDPVRVEAGKKAARTRGLHVRDDEEKETQYEEPTEDQGEGTQTENQQTGKNPNRVRGGKQAARTKGQHVHDDEENDAGELSDTTKDPVRVEAGRKAASHFSHQHFVEMGKKGAAARIEKYHLQRRPHPLSSEGENESETEFDTSSHHDSDYPGKNPHRVEAGKKTASHFTHEHFSELGKKGAAARWGKESSHDQEDDKDQYDYGEQSSKQTGRYRSKREADTNIQSPPKRTRHAVY